MPTKKTDRAERYIWKLGQIKKVSAQKPGKLKEYSPDQPRDPAGGPTGGQWMAGGGGGGTGQGGAGGSAQEFRTQIGADTWSGGLTKPERQAIRVYTSNAGILLNSHLRRGTEEYEFDRLEAIASQAEALGVGAALPDATQPSQEEFYHEAVEDTVDTLISTLDVALEGAQTLQSVVVYRGLDDLALERFRSTLETLGPGAEFEDEGYVSTTRSTTLAKKFAAGGEDFGAVVTIQIPAGAKAAYLPGLSDIPGEEEVLLPRNTRFRVTSTDPLVLEVIL